jgi:hypothetical protein
VICLDVLLRQRKLPTINQVDTEAWFLSRCRYLGW